MGWRGAQLDGESALYESRVRLRAWAGGGGGGVRQLDGLSWTGSMLSTPLASDLGPGPERTAEERSAGRGVCSLRLSPPISSLVRRRWPRSAQLDGGFAFYASRRRFWTWPAGGGGRLHSLTEIWLSTALAAESAPGPEAAARWGVYFLCLSPQVTGLARNGRRRWLRWAQLDREFAFYASRRGLRSWTGSLLCTPLAAAIGPGPEPAVKGAQLDGQFALYAFRLRLRAWAAEGCAA